MGKQIHTSIVFVDCSDYSFVAGCDECDYFREAYTRIDIAKDVAQKHRYMIHDSKGGIRLQ